MLGTVDDASAHAHHALQIAIGLDGTFVLETPTGSLECRSALIAPDQVHRFRGRCGQQTIILIDAQSSVAQSIQSSMSKTAMITEFEITDLQPYIEQLADCAGKPPDCSRIRHISTGILSATSG
jgi:hypothetical protein